MSRYAKGMDGFKIPRLRDTIEQENGLHLAEYAFPQLPGPRSET